MVAMRVRNLGVGLGGHMILRDIGLEVHQPQLVGVIGPNGAGKSTLARAILGLLPRMMGEVEIGGESVRRIRRAELARRISWLPQGQAVHWPLDVERLVGLGRLPHLAPMSRISATDQAAIERAMARTDILYLRHRVATELSGGERARVLLARALAAEAPILIADEPLAALDPGHQIEVMELLRAETRAGVSVLVMLHDLTMAARYCDRLLLLHRGELVADGPPLAVLQPERLAAVYGIRARIEQIDGAMLVIPLDRNI